MGDRSKYDDLWDRLFDLYELPPIEHEDIDRELDWFARHPDFLDRVQTRAEPFLYSIVKQVEKHNLPGEIALLPVIESAFQPSAVSPAKAAGIWQFIPSTGKHYGLKQSRNYDGRRDIYASTRAAIKYLKKLHTDFSGDWFLAIAAYNCGEGAVSRAIQKNLIRGLPTDFWSLDLPSETRTYVPRLLAVSRLFAEADHYGIDLHPIPNKAVYKPVKVTDQVDLALAADAADISVDKMLELNPGFKRPMSDLYGTYRLFIPAEKKAADFKRELNRLAQDSRVYDRPETAQTEPFEIEREVPETRTARVDSPVFPSSRPEVRPPTGPDTNVVAYADVKSRAYVTPTMKVPVFVEPEVDIAPVAEESAPRENARLERRNSRELSAERLRKEAQFRHRVRDALPAARAEDEPRSVRRDRDPEPVEKHHRSSSDKEHSEKAVVEPPAGQRTTYKVQPGDTLFSIARKSGVDVNDLAHWNNVNLKYGVKRGEDFVVYTKEAPKKETGKKMTLAMASRPLPQPAQYTVRDGDTLFSISRRFNVTVADLRKWNGSKVDKQIQTGRSIRVLKDKD